MWVFPVTNCVVEPLLYENPVEVRVRICSRLLLLSAYLSLASASWGLTLPLTVELDGNGLGDYGSVTVTESGGDLTFQIHAGPDLGPGADLQSFYFNLTPDTFTGLTIVSDNAPRTAYSFASGMFPVQSVQGGAGSSFDIGVEFGNGAGPPGNGVLQLAIFTLSADQPLSLALLLETSGYNNGSELLGFVAHFQGTSAFSGSTSEAVGGFVPEPGVGLLVLVSLLWVTRRRSLA